MNAQTLAWPRFDAAAWCWTAGAAGIAVLLAWASVRVNFERACTLREDIAAPYCGPRAASEQADALRARIARNPGDANAYTELALSDHSAAKPRLVEIASRLAPREPNLQLERAAAAFDRGDWATAVPPLIELADKRDVPLAVSALAWLAQNGQGPLLEPYVTPGNNWLPRVVAQTRAAGLPLSGVLPLVVHAARLGVIDAETVRAYVRDLKAAHAWGDAYALWLSLHGKSVPLLFNAGFDTTFELDGFDWEVPATARRPGVVVERRRAEQRGAVLDLQFTSRPMTLPIVRQYLFIAPGRYRLHGDILARQFRMEAGLVWAVRCDGNALAGASDPLRDTLGLWRNFEFEFTVPPGCGAVASLQLETPAPADAVLGARGRMSFDAFSLERIGP